MRSFTGLTGKFATPSWNFTCITTRIHPTLRLSGVAQDADDHRILECAVAARADYLITGDKHHLQPLKHFRGIQIVSPREFLDHLR